jgi:xylulose-5-phosphate/fructose-6-phosphate phosphoketolase
MKVRFVNVVDLFKLIPNGYHPHGLTDAEYTSLFTNNRPIVFAFHSYPWLVHRLTYNRPGQQLLHVRGYKEKGNINTPLELAIRNEADRFSLAILAIDNMKDKLGNRGAGAREKLLEMRIRAKNHVYETGMDVQEFTDWTWPF